MSGESGYTLYHPRWHRPRVSVWWWLKKWTYVTFVLRELTSVFVALFALVTLWLLHAVTRGPEAYADLMARLGRPLWVALHVLTLAFVLFHTITWFHLAPKAMVVRLGSRRLPDSVVVAAHYALWIVLSVVVGAVLLWRR
jgi:fumarate reductase subunit C